MDAFIHLLAHHVHVTLGDASEDEDQEDEVEESAPGKLRIDAGAILEKLVRRKPSRLMQLLKGLVLEEYPDARVSIPTPADEELPRSYNVSARKKQKTGHSSGMARGSDHAIDNNRSRKTPAARSLDSSPPADFISPAVDPIIPTAEVPLSPSSLPSSDAPHANPIPQMPSAVQPADLALHADLPPARANPVVPGDSAPMHAPEQVVNINPSTPEAAPPSDNPPALNSPPDEARGPVEIVPGTPALDDDSQRLLVSHDILGQLLCGEDVVMQPSDTCTTPTQTPEPKVTKKVKWTAEEVVRQAAELVRGNPHLANSYIIGCSTAFDPNTVMTWTEQELTAAAVSTVVFCSRQTSTLVSNHNQGVVLSIWKSRYDLTYDVMTSRTGLARNQMIRAIRWSSIIAEHNAKSFLLACPASWSWVRDHFDVLSAELKKYPLVFAAPTK